MSESWGLPSWGLAAHSEIEEHSGGLLDMQNLTLPYWLHLTRFSVIPVPLWRTGLMCTKRGKRREMDRGRSAGCSPGTAEKF